MGAPAAAGAPFSQNGTRRMTKPLIAAALAALLAAPAAAGSDSTAATTGETAAATAESAEATAGEAAGEAAAEETAEEATDQAAEEEASEEETAADDAVSTPPEPFTEEFLADAAHIDAGKAIWEEQCRHCHGKSAYPGKAPKLKPAKYEPDFVYRRVTDGFRKMPPWKDVYSDEERMAVTAYILSEEFSP